jgi:hypothetical protein
LHENVGVLSSVLSEFIMRFPVQTPNTTRRCFMLQAVTAAGAALVVTEASAQAMVDEKDPQAVGLNYKADATKVDKAKAPKYAAGQNCGNCALYQGGSAASGGCPLFAGKQVAAKGWCTAWAKKG